MSAWIELDGVRSDTFSGLIVTNVTPFIRTRKKTTRTALSGRLGQIEEGEPTLETADISFDLHIHGDSRVSAMERARQLSAWLNGTILRTYLEPGYYCTGSVEAEVNATKASASGRSLTLSCKFTANPGCMMQAPNGFIPSADAPIPEQITGNNASSAQSFTEQGRLPAMTDGSTYGPELYFKVNGTWTQLAIGTMVITQEFATNDTLYIDCENQVVYHMDGSDRAGVAYSGSFPTNDQNGIVIGGTDIDVTVYVMKIGRW